MTKKKFTTILLLVTLFMGLIISPGHNGHTFQPFNLIERETDH